MVKLLSFVVALILSYPGQDVHVATWSTGTPDSDTYESLSFWIKDNKRAYIRYAHGKDAESVDLRWLGPDSLPGARGFLITSPPPSATPLFVAPKGDSLRVSDHEHYDKSFHWENENDTTATCSICAKTGKQAIGWLRSFFF